MFSIQGSTNPEVRERLDLRAGEVGFADPEARSSAYEVYSDASGGITTRLGWVPSNQDMAAFMSGRTDDPPTGPWIAERKSATAVRLHVNAGSPHRIFVHEGRGTVSWSTSLTHLAAAIGAAVERGWEDFLLLYGFVPLGNTSFSGIRVLGPGSTLDIRNGVGEASTHHPPAATGAAAPDSYDAVVDTLYDRFMESLGEQADGHRRVGVYLGGFDSALVASGLRRLGLDVTMYTYRYGDKRYDQPLTDLVASTTGADHAWLEVDVEMIGRGLADFGRHFQAPSNWPNYLIQTREVGLAMQQDGHSMAFSGDGCDFLFYGYPLTYQRSVVVSKMGSLPAGLHRSLLKVAERPVLDRFLGRPYVVGMSLLRSAGREWPQNSHLTFKVLDEVSLQNLRMDDPRPAMPIEQVLVAMAAGLEDSSPTRVAYSGKNETSPSRVKLAGTIEASGIPILSPYLAGPMRHYVLGLPDELLRPAGGSAIGKQVLVDMAQRHRLLPDEVIFQPKLAAADAPTDAWYRGPLRRSLDQLFAELPFDVHPEYLNRLLSRRRVEEVYGRLISGNTAGIVTLDHAASLLATYGSQVAATK